jgi:isopenicillin N synthase-like dioxygenase
VPVFPPSTENDSTPPILINIGDLLSHWTNNLLKSTVHRVVFPAEAKKGGEDRYSIAYFCHPENSTKLVEVPSEIVKAHKEKTAGLTGGHNKVEEETMTAKEHLMSRLAATYGWGKENDEVKVEVATA